MHIQSPNSSILQMVPSIYKWFQAYTNAYTKFEAYTNGSKHTQMHIQSSKHIFEDQKDTCFISL